MVDDEALQRLDLSRFDAIVIGPGAYSARAELRAAAPRLLDYMDGGGTLIVQYQPYAIRRRAWPHPFRHSVPHDRVTDEGARVRFLAPQHPLPGAQPDRGRGLRRLGRRAGRYFLATGIGATVRPWLALIRARTQRGGLIVADYGRGTYVYCGYSLHRQLPAGVQGPFRLFANLLALQRFASQRGWIS